MMEPKEYTWLLDHPEVDTQYPGEYVAIVDDSVVAHGKDLHAVVDEAEKHGNEPLIHKVPHADKDLIV